MIIKLSNGLELHPIMATGERAYAQGAYRDTLNFIFPETEGLDELDAVFAAENCETITIVEGDNEYVYKGYTIRAGLNRSPMVVRTDTETAEEIVEQRVTVSMSQRTDMENQTAELNSAMNALLMGEE